MRTRKPSPFRKRLPRFNPSSWRRVGFWLAGILLTIPPALSQPNPIAQRIRDAAARGESRVVLPPGEYRITPEHTDLHLLFENLSSLEIAAEGVTLVLTDPSLGGIRFLHCTDVHFHGATIRYETLPFTQGRVTRIESARHPLEPQPEQSPEQNSYDIEIDAGYPDALDDPLRFPPQPTGYVFDPATRLLKRGIPDLHSTNVERLAPGRFHLSGTNVTEAGLQVGDLVAFRGLGDHNLTLVDSSRMWLEDITIESAGIFAFFEIDSDGGNRYSRLRVTREPTPIGATEPPLLSSNADAFHSTNVRHGPIVEDSAFEFMGDDGIAVHGTFSQVIGAVGNRLTVSGDRFRPGDPIRLIDAHGTPAGEAIIQTRIPASEIPDPELSQATAHEHRITLELDRPLAAHPGDLAMNPAASGSGYILRNNTIRFHRARGMLLKADHGLVEGNEIVGSTIAGILLTPELQWNEAGFSRHVRITGNFVRETGGAGDPTGGILIGAFDLTGPETCGHRDLRIDHNQLIGIFGAAMLVQSACQVSVEANRIAALEQESAGDEWRAAPELDPDGESAQSPSGHAHEGR